MAHGKIAKTQELSDGTRAEFMVDHTNDRLQALEIQTLFKQGKFEIVPETTIQTAPTAFERGDRDFGIKRMEENLGSPLPFLEGGAKTILPAGGEALGQFIGGRVAGPPGRAVVGGLFAGVGEMVNQLLGITERSTTQVMLAFGLGPLLSGGGFIGKRLGKGAVKRIPGTEAATNELGAEAGERFSKSLLPGDDVNAMWDIIDNFDDILDFDQTRQAADAILTQRTALATSGGSQIARRATAKSAPPAAGVADVLGTQDVRRLPDGTLLTPGKIRFKEARELQRGVKDLQSQAGKAGAGQDYQRLKDFHQAFEDDILLAIESGSLPKVRADLLLKAMRLNRQKMAGLEVADAVRLGTSEIPGGFIRYDPSKIVAKLKDPAFKKGITSRVGEEEYKRILDFYSEQNLKIIPIPTQGLEQAGVPGSFSRAIIAGGAASLLGAENTTAGKIAGAAVVLPILLGKLSVTRSGRDIIKKILKDSPTSSKSVSKLIVGLQAARAATAPSGPLLGGEVGEHGAPELPGPLKRYLERTRSRITGQ